MANGLLKMETLSPNTELSTDIYTHRAANITRETDSHVLFIHVLYTFIRKINMKKVFRDPLLPHPTPSIEQFYAKTYKT